MDELSVYSGEDANTVLGYDELLPAIDVLADNNLVDEIGGEVDRNSEHFKEGYLRILGGFDTLKHEGKSVILQRDGKTVSMSTWDTRGKTNDGRTIFYFARSVVMPEYQGQGLAQRMLEERERMAQEMEPGAPMVFCTKLDSMKHIAEKHGYKYIPVQEYLDLIQSDEKGSDEIWKYYIKDPMKSDA